MFDVANWVACLNGENGPGGRLHMRPFQFHLKEHWRFPQSLDSLLPWTAHLESWQNPTNVMKGTDLHPKTTVSNSLQTPQTKAGALTLQGSVVRPGNKATHKCSRAEGVFSGPSKVQGPVFKQNSVACYRQLNIKEEPTRRRCALSCGRS